VESILESIKKLLGNNSDDYFDPDLIIYINSVFSTLHQLGVGPDTPFSIAGPDETWDDFQAENLDASVKTYVMMRVKLMFDPPNNSFLIDNYKKQIEELEYRMNVRAEHEYRI